MRNTTLLTLCLIAAILPVLIACDPLSVKTTRDAHRTVSIKGKPRSAHPVANFSCDQDFGVSVVIDTPEAQPDKVLLRVGHAASTDHWQPHPAKGDRTGYVAMQPRSRHLFWTIANSRADHFTITIDRAYTFPLSDRAREELAKLPAFCVLVAQ